jgi:hypothetical protein
MHNPSHTGAGDMVTNDADTRFERLVSEPRIAITLTTAVLVTAIIWITTFIATVSSAAAYLAQITATPASDEPFQPLSATASFRTTALATTASHSKDLPGDVVLQSGPAMQQTVAAEAMRIAVPPPKVSSQLLPVSAPASQNVEVRTENATMPPVRSAQDQSAGTEQASIAETALVADASDNRCADGVWGSLCRERMRWANCHPDKWDLTPECAVQKFNSYNVQ